MQRRALRLSRCLDCIVLFAVLLTLTLTGCARPKYETDIVAPCLSSKADNSSVQIVTVSDVNFQNYFGDLGLSTWSWGMLTLTDKELTIYGGDWSLIDGTTRVDCDKALVVRIDEMRGVGIDYFPYPTGRMRMQMFVNLDNGIVAVQFEEHDALIYRGAYESDPPELSYAYLRKQGVPEKPPNHHLARAFFRMPRTLGEMYGRPAWTRGP